MHRKGGSADWNLSTKDTGERCNGVLQSTLRLVQRLPFIPLETPLVEPANADILSRWLKYW